MKPYSSHKFDPKSKLCIFWATPLFPKAISVWKSLLGKCIFPLIVFFMNLCFHPCQVRILCLLILLHLFLPLILGWLLCFLSLFHLLLILLFLCSPSSTDTASLPVPDTILAIVPTVSPPLSTPSVSTKTHPMLTRSKNGIFKPKAYAVQADYAVTEPPSYAVASKFSHWVATMDSKFASLQQQHA